MKQNLAVAPETVRGMMALMAIAECSSSAAAAKDLGLTASAVSKLVSRMEERRVLQELDASELELQQHTRRRARNRILGRRMMKE
jgi:hypothetical protein